MGLDVCVYCDCVEKQKLIEPHPYPKQLFIGRNGSPEIRSVDAAKVERHDTWMQMPPCKHDEMTAASAHLGNAGHIKLLRDSLSASDGLQKQCPTLLSRVLQSGTHTGDFLTNHQVISLASELKALKKTDLGAVGLTSPQVVFLRSLISDLNLISKAALKLQKPIAF